MLLNFLKKIKYWITGIFLATAFAATVPVIEVPLQWIHSYETITFNTTDGDLSLDEYADAGDGGWYVRNVEKSKGQFEWTDNVSNIAGKTEVSILAEKSANNPDCIGCAYYDVFRKRNGEIVRVRSTQEKYNGLRYVKNHPQPKRTEMVSVFSAREAEGAIAFDATSNSGRIVSSSGSWSHTTTGTDLVMIMAGSASDNSSTDSNITGFTYNSVSGTEVRRDVNASAESSEIWYLADPDTGTNTVTVTYGGSTIFVAGVVTITGADTLDANNGTTYTDDSTPSVVLTTVANNSFVFGVVVSDLNTGTGETAVSGTDRWNVEGSSIIAIGSTYGLQTPAGNITVGWENFNGFSDGGVSTASFAPAGAAPAAAPTPVPEIIWDGNVSLDKRDIFYV